MTRNPRDHRDWTNEELEADPKGYLAAQDAYRKDRAAEQQRKRDADDLSLFTEEFVKAGGSRYDAAAAFKAHRNQRAAEAAKRADQEAVVASRQRVRGRV